MDAVKDFFCRTLAKHGATVVGIDIAEKQIEWASLHEKSQWSNLIEKAGFAIRRLHEPRPTIEQVENNPELEDCYRLPYFLIFDLVKSSSRRSQL